MSRARVWVSLVVAIALGLGITRASTISNPSPSTGTITGPAACVYYLTANQSCANTTEVQLSGFTKLFDTSVAQFYAGGSPNIFTIPITGTYLMVGQLKYASSAVGVRYVRLYKGTAGITDTINAACTSAGEFTLCQATALKAFTAGDTVSIRAYQDSTGTLNALAGVPGTSNTCMLSITLIPGQ